MLKTESWAHAVGKPEACKFMSCNTYSPVYICEGLCFYTFSPLPLNTL